MAIRRRANDLTSFGQTFVKLGLSERSDIELVTPAYVRFGQRERPRWQSSGIGDVSCVTSSG